LSVAGSAVFAVLDRDFLPNAFDLSKWLKGAAPDALDTFRVTGAGT
jgi:hypothetical protein